jgi:DegV family protein with EDD domain
MNASSIARTNRLDGYILRNSFLSGYERLLLDKNKINDINVFPVADGDTGNNMVSTFYSTVSALPVTRSLTGTLDAIADRALSGARGNSGIILAQYLNGLARECSGHQAMGAREFGVALSNAASHAYRALENPREGTLLTVLRIWSDEMRRLGDALPDFSEIFITSVAAAREALSRTKEQLAELKKANVVDAGASGFVSFLEGVAHMIVTGELPVHRAEYSAEIATSEFDTHDVFSADGNIPFRYCTEALLSRSYSDDSAVRTVDQVRVENALRDEDALRDELMARLSPLGNSLVLGLGREKTRVHIHTNEPAALFRELSGYGKIIEQKVDDMALQFNAVHRPVSKIAIVTDSIADIPRELVDALQIHVIPQKIVWGEEEYLDRLTMTGSDFYSMLSTRKDSPGSSVPDPRRAGQVFSWLSSHYNSVIAIPVGKALSGTWQVMKNAAKPLEAGGFPVTVVDSKLNSAAQGLVVLSAARAAAEGKNYAEILGLIGTLVAKARIYVSVADIKFMVRGGRVSAAKGLVAAIGHLKPIVTLDAEGHGAIGGFAFTAKSARAKILSRLIRARADIGSYAVVYAGAVETAAAWAEELTLALGKKPEYVMEISPVVGMHAGIGCVAVAYI